MQVHKQIRREGVGIEDVSVVDVEVADTAADLILGDFKTKFLLFGEGEFLQHDDIAVGLREVVGMVDHIDGRKLDGL